eukprot:gene1741-biopygen1255
MANFVKGGWSGADTFTLGSMTGIVAAIPFAIWFFLAIEGVAMAAEEAKNPKRSIPIAYIGGIPFGERLIRAGKKVFFDLKLHDIPNTVERATAQIEGLDDIADPAAAQNARVKVLALVSSP